MDLDSLKSQVSNLTLYDLKAGFRKAQNAVMNYTEMEAKVREATNNEPWGASSTMQQDIANGTFNYATLNEIMPMIYKRFTEKSAEEWRQIYKALQLLEFLIKNGSERVIDDARSHLSLLKMLRQFHYIDQNGKDQGINVRNRAKELGELLGDVDRIRSERKKARATRNKYGGVEGGAGLGGGSSSGSSGRYGGFGSESASTNYGGFSGGVYGDGGGFGGQSSDYADTAAGSRRDRYEEYDEYDDGGATAPTSSRRTAAPSASRQAPAAKAEPPKPKAPEVDLFDFGDDDIPAPSVAATTVQKPAASSAGIVDDDDFDDFQSAAPATTSTAAAIAPQATTQFAVPQPLAPPPQTNAANNVLGALSPPPANKGIASNYSAFSSPPPPLQSPPTSNVPAMQAKPAGFQASAPNYYGSIATASGNGNSGGQNQGQHQRGVSGVSSPSISTKPSTTTKSPSAGDPFASLAIGGGASKKSTTKGPTMADLSKQKANQGLWGAPASQSQGSGGAELL